MGCSSECVCEDYLEGIVCYPQLGQIFHQTISKQERTGSNGGHGCPRVAALGSKRVKTSPSTLFRVPEWVDILEWFYLVVYCIELGLRFYVFRQGRLSESDFHGFPAPLGPCFHMREGDMNRGTCRWWACWVATRAKERLHPTATV